MEKIEPQLRDLLQGKSPNEGSAELCDYSISEQNQDAVVKGANLSIPDDFRPILKKNVTYIVCTVVINDQDEVLLVQEAKSSYAGTWYLPAGQMEPGETIEEAAKREMVEETGLQVQHTTLLMVETAHSSWIRFVFVGDIIAGKLKTTAESNNESLQARWMSDLNHVHLRSSDILPLIDFAMLYKKTRNQVPWHESLMPVLRPYEHQFIRSVIVARKKTNNRVHTLVAESTTAHLPLCEMNPTQSLYSTLKKFMHRTFPNELPPHKPHGILCVEHVGKPAGKFDGLCLTILISVRQALEDVALADGFTWLELSEDIATKLLQRLEKNMAIVLNVIR